MKFVVAILLLSLAACHHLPDEVVLYVEHEPLSTLSQYGFFKSPVELLVPNAGVMEYKLVNTMFSDYAQKRSFVYLPENKKCDVDTNGNVALPEGSCLINCVYYPNNESDNTWGNLMVETQLLMRKKDGWVAYNYVWNQDQSDAVLQNIGSEKQIEYKRVDGSMFKVDFLIAGKNQCRSCHNKKSKTVPIGFSNVRHLVLSDSLKEMFNHSDLIAHQQPHTNWQDKTATLENRVRGYLHMNCAHCHSEDGPAAMSGLYLTYDNYNMEHYGVCKSPPSSGKGSCNLSFDIVPGSPGHSIMVCRMASNDLETKMPELGRTVSHTEGVKLIIEWIQSMEPSACKAEQH